MGFSATRLTLHALLSAMEEDLRALIGTYLDGHASSESLLSRDVWAKATERLGKDQGMLTDEPDLKHVLYYVDFADLYQCLNGNRSALPGAAAKELKAVTPQLQSLVPIRNRVAHTRPLHFDDLARTLDVSQTLTERKALQWNALRSTLQRLQTEPSFVLGLEIPAHTEDDRLCHNLPTPDFDETGFIGRSQEVSDVVSQCLGPYPIITIVGEGGIGKSALALKVAYEILDREESPFDAVVWSSSKTTQLTGHEVTEIEGAIKDSLGVFDHVAKELAGQAAVDPMEEVLMYLKEFKILLIVDNLETVLDDRIRSFAQRLPQGSKVLITSRIGLGAFEVPVKLSAMDSGEAIQLLRALAKIRGASHLVRISNNRLKKYCERMKNNPGFIKWFVSAVQVGRRPEDVLANPDIFLEFCMSNVYEYLSETSKKVLRSMLFLGKQHSQAELAYINQVEVVEFQQALQQLLSTNMVKMISVPVGSSYESRYDLSELARSYLSKNHPVDPAEYRELARKKRQLLAAGDQIRAEKKANPYSAFNIMVRSTSDFVIAKYLMDALQQVKGERFEVAGELVSKARDLAPDYFEVHRVEAWVKASQGHLAAAKDAYETAINLAPDRAQIRFWYGGFLLRYFDDLDGAKEQLIEARRLDLDAAEIELELARVQLYSRDYGPAREAIIKLQGRKELAEWTKRKVYDLYMQYYCRLAEDRVKEKNTIGALEALQELRSAFEQCPRHVVDAKLKATVQRALPTAKTCARFLDAENAVLADALGEWVDRVTASAEATLTNSVEGASLSGEIIRLPIHENFGFIKADHGIDFFFHRAELVNPEEWGRLSVGDRLEFVVGVREQRPCALRVRREDDSASSLEAGQDSRHHGEVVRVIADRGFGFLRSSAGPEHFFHMSGFVRPSEWERLAVGDRLYYDLGTDDQGRSRAFNITVDDEHQARRLAGLE